MTEKKSAKKADGLANVLAKIDGLAEPYRTMGERLHAVIMAAVPTLQPKLFYGMPGYTKGGPVICFFRADGEYLTFGLGEKAFFSVEDGAPHQLMASAWFLTSLDEATEAEITAIVRKAAQ